MNEPGQGTRICRRPKKRKGKRKTDHHRHSDKYRTDIGFVRRGPPTARVIIRGDRVKCTSVCALNVSNYPFNPMHPLYPLYHQNSTTTPKEIIHAREARRGRQCYFELGRSVAGMYMKREGTNPKEPYTSSGVPIALSRRVLTSANAPGVSSPSVFSTRLINFFKAPLGSSISGLVDPEDIECIAAVWSLTQ